MKCHGFVVTGTIQHNPSMVMYIFCCFNFCKKIQIETFINCRLPENHPGNAHLRRVALAMDCSPAHPRRLEDAAGPSAMLKPGACCRKTKKKGHVNSAIRTGNDDSFFRFVYVDITFICL